MLSGFLSSYLLLKLYIVQSASVMLNCLPDLYLKGLTGGNVVVSHKFFSILAKY